MKFSIFATEKNLCLLHGHVFVMRRLSADTRLCLEARTAYLLGTLITWKFMSEFSSFQQNFLGRDPPTPPPPPPLKRTGNPLSCSPSLVPSTLDLVFTGPLYGPVFYPVLLFLCYTTSDPSQFKICE